MRTSCPCFVHDLCMPTKTISLEIDAYDKLRRARREARESFSSVVRRARWDDVPPNARRLLEDLRALCRRHPEVLLDAATLDTLERRPKSHALPSGPRRDQPVD